MKAVAPFPPRTHAHIDCHTLARLFSSSALYPDEVEAIERDYALASREQEEALSGVLDALYPRAPMHLDSSESQSQSLASQTELESILHSQEEGRKGAGAAGGEDEERERERREQVERVGAILKNIQNIHANMAMFQALPRAADSGLE
jgi:hypothetical protein